MSENFRVVLAVAVLLPLLVTSQAQATPIDVPGGIDLNVSSLTDLYVFVPNGLFVDEVTFDAEITVIFEGVVNVELNDPKICDAGCALQTIAENGDVAVQILDPMGAVSFTAQRIILSSTPIPEPSTLTLVALGLGGLALWRNRAPYRS